MKSDPTIPTFARDQLLRRKMPAWLMSLVLHLASVLLAALLVGGTQLPAPQDEAARPAGIVLAFNPASERTDYFTPERIEGGFAPKESAEERGPAEATGTSDPLAAASSEPPPAAVELPTLPGAMPLIESGLVTRLQSGSGKGSRLPGLTAADKAAILAQDAARQRPVVPSGPTAKLSLFGSGQAEGRSFVFVIDRSASMGGDGLGAIEAAVKELAASIDRLSAEHTFQVIAYNQKALYLTGKELIPATDSNKQQLIKFVQNTAAYGATQHDIGLFAALRLKPDVIFLLTDGGDPYLNPGQMRAVRTASAGKTAIHCLQFGSGPLGDERSFLAVLAEQNGGSYAYIDMAERR